MLEVLEYMISCIAIPVVALAWLMMRSASHSPVESHASRRNKLLMLGLVLMSLGGLSLLLALVCVLTCKRGPEISLWDGIALGHGGLALATGFCSWQLGRRLPVLPDDTDRAPGRDTDRNPAELSAPARRPARRSILAELAQCGCLLLLIISLLSYGWILVLLFWGLMFGEYGVYRLMNAARESRLLWSLAMAARWNRPFPAELLQLETGEPKRRQKRLRRAAELVEQGLPLSAALWRCRLLSHSSCMLIQAGELAGNLPEVLQKLALRQAQQMQFRTVRSVGGEGLLVLTGVLSALLLLGGFVAYYIMPKYKAILYDFGTEMPQVTTQLIRVADAFVDAWYLIVLGVLIILIVTWRLATQEKFRHRISRWISVFWPRVRAPGLLRFLSVSVQEQRPPAEALRQTSLNLSGTASREGWQNRLADRLEQGESLGEALSAEGILRQAEGRSLALAQQAGNADWAMNVIADRIDQSRWIRWQRWSSLLTPLAMLLCGGMVLFFCLAMFAPLVKIINDLS
jgi:type IV pilus assembly protein PilC